MNPALLGPLLLALLFVFTVLHLVTMKLCSGQLPHRATPVFISGWTLAGLLAVYPLYGGLLSEGLHAFAAHPFLLALALFKGFLLHLLLVVSQGLMKESLSSRHYVTPMSVGLIAMVNFFLGEHLTPQQWASALGLCGLAAAFFFKGHMADLSRQSRVDYFKLVALAVVLAAIDQQVLKTVNWYAFLFVANIVLLISSLAHNRGRVEEVLKPALFHKTAIIAGACYAATELLKFYQMVSINPVTAVVTVQAVTKPVIMVLGALIWKERTVKEQLAWGLAAFVLVMAPHFFG